MANERLRAAMDRTRVSITELAIYTGKDPKTVGRWMGGRLPHPQTRHLIAKRLKEDEDFLWPGATKNELETGGGSEIIATYPYRSNMPVSGWWNLITRSTRQIDLLGYTLYFLPMQHPQLVATLLDKCRNGCKIRAAVADPRSLYVADREAEENLAMTLTVRIFTTLKYFKDLRHCENFELRYQNVPLYNSVFRFDDEILATPHLFATPGAEAPLLHLRRLNANGMFSRFADHFDRVWMERTRDLTNEDWEQGIHSAA